MRKVIVSTYVTLDGVMEGPDKWMDGIHFQLWNDEMSKYAEDLLFSCDALLLGRVTYDGFAEAWPSRSGDKFSDRMNSMRKYVASTTLQGAPWNNTEIIRSDVPAEVSRLKQQPGKDILIYGSAGLMHSLMERDLIDEYRIWIDPIIVGQGKPLFKKGVTPRAWNLTDSTRFGTGVVVLTYRPARDAHG